MTHKIARSLVGPGFELAVSEHAGHMRDWRAQERKVALDKKNGVGPDEAHSPFPRPRSHPEVEACVNENDEVDFEIIEDGPTPEQRLRWKKNELLQKIVAAESEAIENVSLPLGKRRAANLLESEILSADATLRPPGLAKRALAAVGLAELPTAETIRAARPDEHNEHLDAQENRRKRITEIVRQASVMMSDVEDLTTETVEKWQMPGFEDCK